MNTNFSSSKLFSFALVAMAATGCTEVTDVVVLTDAPAGRIARVDVEAGEISLSKNVAVGLECMFTGPDEETGAYLTQPCPGLVVDHDGEHVEVLPAHLEGVLYPYAGSYGADPNYGAGQVEPTGEDRTAVVLVGREAGSEEVTFTHERFELTFTVTVIDEAAAEGEATEE